MPVSAGTPPPSPSDVARAPAPVLSPVTTRLTALLERMAGDTTRGAGTAAAAAAKEEFLRATGRVHEGDPIFDQRMAQFTEWFLLDRPLSGPGSPTPCERWVAERGPERGAEERADAVALGASHRGLLCFSGRMGPEALCCDDLLGGIRWIVTAAGPPPGLAQGDVFEARLAGRGGEVHFTGAFCYHPPEVAAPLRRALGRLAERGRPAIPVLEQLMSWRLSYDRAEGVPAHRIYRLDAL